MEEALKQSNDINAALRRQIAERDAIINLTQQVAELMVRYDDIEQQDRKDSIKVFGHPEDGVETLETKLLMLMDENMQLDPPINPEEIEVAHRLGKPHPNLDNCRQMAKAPPAMMQQPMPLKLMLYHLPHPLPSGLER